MLVWIVQHTCWVWHVALRWLKIDCYLLIFSTFKLLSIFTKIRLFPFAIKRNALALSTCVYPFSYWSFYHSTYNTVWYNEVIRNSVRPIHRNIIVKSKSARTREDGLTEATYSSPHESQRRRVYINLLLLISIASQNQWQTQDYDRLIRDLYQALCLVDFMVQCLSLRGEPLPQKTKI